MPQVSAANSPATSPSKEGGNAAAGEDEVIVRARREAAALQLDTEARTALFHACASDHFACTELLLLLAPAAVTQADKFGDTVRFIKTPVSVFHLFYHVTFPYLQPFHEI